VFKFLHVQTQLKNARDRSAKLWIFCVHSMKNIWVTFVNLEVIFEKLVVKISYTKVNQHSSWFVHQLWWKLSYFDLWDHSRPLAKEKCSNKVKWARFIWFCMHFYSKIISIFFTLDVMFDPLPARKRLEKEYMSTMTSCIDFILGFDFFDYLTILKACRRNLGFWRF